jgi:hypothetical protein
MRITKRKNKKNRKSRRKKYIGGTSDSIKIKIDKLKQLLHSDNLISKIRGQPTFTEDWLTSNLITSEEVQDSLLELPTHCLLPRYLRQIRKILGLEEKRQNFFSRRFTTRSLTTTPEEIEDKKLCDNLFNEGELPENIIELEDDGQNIVRLKAIDQKVDIQTLLISNYNAVIAILAQFKEIYIAKFYVDPTVKENFFTRFLNFKLVSKVTMITGSNNNNGKVYKVDFEKFGLEASAILKLPIDKAATNLFYEYRVGLFLNDKARIYPCFIKTWGLYKHGFNMDRINYQITQQNIGSPVAITIDTKNIEKQILDSCKSSANFALMIEHIEGETVLKFVENRNMNSVSRLYKILYQIYYPLYQMREIFSHNDMHTENVMIYKPFGNEKKFILMKYWSSNTECITFKTHYLAKIIDYGTCFAKGMSEEHISLMCKNYLSCGFFNHCGYEKIMPNSVYNVYTLHNKAKYEKLTTELTELRVEEKSQKNNERKKRRIIDIEKQLWGIKNWPDATKKNESYDIWLYHDLYVYLNDTLVLTTPAIEDFGIEHMDNTYTVDGSQISNLTDMMNMLKDKFISSVVTDDEYNTTDWKHGATLDVYWDDKPFKYEIIADT